ncbi:hypothetical protein KB1_04910 [Cutibacterium modestum]|uniref:Uncharacterized protein n=1 Tax=Cutibacterium modestum TaxID=2559073 RepID=A0AAD1NVI8_9ACTN|nr:hypothetical protein KB1_04910 [Cutibacterium modestum]
MTGALIQSIVVSKGYLTIAGYEAISLEKYSHENKEVRLNYSGDGYPCGTI